MGDGSGGAIVLSVSRAQETSVYAMLPNPNNPGLV